MINGPWGIGKTYLVKRFLNKTIREPDKYVYVSLFGLTTLDDIDGALLEAIYPLVGSKVAKIGGRIIKAALKFKGINFDFDLRDVVDKFKPRIFVFDDLERCEMSINVVMGYINELVEHDGCKVIIIANENEIVGGKPTDKEKKQEGSKETEYGRRREKLIGQTLEVQSAFDEAFDFFVTQIDHDDTKSLFQKNNADVKSIYAQSELNNLRILQQTMWDFERVCRPLTDQHRRNAEAMTALLRLISALSFEIKAGRLRVDDLRHRTDWLFLAAREKDGEEKNSRRRYPEVDLSDRVISDETLIDILIRGIVDEKAIRACLDRSRYFVTVANEPAWVTVWHMFDRTDEQFEVAYEKMEKQFAKRDFSATGELLHVLALRLYLARNDVSGKTLSDVVDEGKRYIDDLYATRRLDVSAAEFRDLRFNGHAGLGFTDGESAEFGELSTYLVEKADRVVKENYPQVGLSLLKEMETDPDLYLRRVCLTNSSDNLYYDVPILASIDPDKFVETLLSLHPSNQRIILRAFRGRYEFDGLGRGLASEKPWLEVVQEKLITKANTMPPIGKYRLLSGVKINITRALDNIKKS
jgi:KAP family P-loop domain